MHAHGLVHGGFEHGFRNSHHRIDLFKLTGGKQVVVYGQIEVTRDLMDARTACGAKTVYEARNVRLHDFDGIQPRVTYTKGGVSHEAASDVRYLARGLTEFYADKSAAGVDAYFDRSLRRVWKAVRFSWWFTSLMHRFQDTGEVGQKIQEAEIRYLLGSTAASTALAENYVGLPY